MSPLARINSLQSYFLWSFRKRFTYFQFVSFFLLLFLLFLYPGQNFYQTYQLSSGTRSTVSPIFPPIDVPTFIGQDYPELTAQSVFILDSNSSTILFEKNPDIRLHPASTTKIMTALVALDAYSLDQLLTVKTANDATGNTIKLHQGDQLTVRDLLFGLLVASANDAAVTLAENFPEGYAGFVAAMNQKAQGLNLRNTSFSNVSGIESLDHRTTVRDLAILTKEALKSDLIREIVSTKKAVIAAKNTQNKYQLNSTNELLDQVEGVKGFKTGWTENAGECLITYVERQGHPLIIVLLNSTDRFGESKTLIDWVYSNHIWTVL